MMITKYRSPGLRSWVTDKVEERTFERETEKCLFDSKGNRTLKVQNWAIYHDTREQAQKHLDSLNAERQRKDSADRIRKAAPALLEALERVVSSKNAIHMEEMVYLNCIKAIAAAKEE